MEETHFETPSSKGLVRAIGRWSLAALVVNCIVGSGVFGLPSVLAAKVGVASVSAVLLAAVAASIVMTCFAEVSSRFAETGGPYLYARTAFGRFMGIQVGWLLWFVRLTACAANANLFVTYLAEFFPRSTDTIPKLTILTLLIGGLAAVNIRGVRAGKDVSNGFTAAKLASLLAVILIGAAYLATHAPVVHAKVAASATDWAQAMVLLIFAYGGFETALISASEVRNPARDMPFGLFAGLVTCAVIYSLIQWVVVSILPDPAHSARPLADVAQIAVGRGGAVLIALGALTSVYGYLSGNMLATPRITFALAERGDFPAFFAAVHPRFRTPHCSIFTFALLVWLLALFGTFAGNATLSAGSRLFSYGIVCAALPVLRRKRKTPSAIQIPGGTLLAVAGVLMCIALLTRIQYDKSFILFAAVGVAFLNWLVVRRKPGTEPAS